MGLAALVSFLVGSAMADSPAPLIVGVVVCALLSLLADRLLRR